VVDGDNDDDTPIALEKHLGEQMLDFWNVCREKSIAPLSIAAWFCLPQEEIRKDVLANSTGQDQVAVGLVIGTIYYPIRNKELAVIRQTFGREFDDFQTKRGPAFSRPFIFNEPEVKTAPHQWHKIYSISRDAKVFGQVACHVCSKPLGCGSAQRTWGAFKHLKNGKGSHLGAGRTVYGAACIEKGRSMQAAEETSGLVIKTPWSDADIVFWMEAMAGLSNANVPAAVVPVPVPVPVPGKVVPVLFVPAPVVDLVAGWLFRSWMEDNNKWLDMDTNHALAKGRLFT
jgi:hypothetical protein